MELTTAVVLLVSVLCLVNLALTLGIIRRLRMHPDLTSIGEPEPELTRPVGASVDEFEAITTTGLPVSRDALGVAGGAFIAFFSAHCRTCLTHVPRFLDHAGSMPPERVLAVVTGHHSAAEELVSRLEPAVRVVVEPEEGPISAAFGVVGTPVFVRTDSANNIVATGLNVNVVFNSVRI